jgi:hypothetical protein
LKRKFALVLESPAQDSLGRYAGQLARNQGWSTVICHTLGDVRRELQTRPKDYPLVFLDDDCTRDNTGRDCGEELVQVHNIRVVVLSTNPRLRMKTDVRTLLLVRIDCMRLVRTMQLIRAAEADLTDSD